MKHDRVISEVLGEEIALSPSDLLNQQFKRTTFGGYQRRQVDDYIERVADVLEGLINQVRQLKEKNDEQRRAIAEFQDIEMALRKALLTTQQHGNQMLEAARREAHIILEEAKLKRAQAQMDATKLPTQIARDINMLEQQRGRLRVELSADMETHRKLIDSLVPDDKPKTPVGFFQRRAGGSLFRRAAGLREEPIKAIPESVEPEAKIRNRKPIEDQAVEAGDPVPDESTVELEEQDEFKDEQE